MQICASSLRRQYFSDVLNGLQQKDLQLLRDVDTRWSSTLLMVERALILHSVSILPCIQLVAYQLNLKAIKEFLEKYKTDFPELRKFVLAPAEWDALKVFQKILEVSKLSVVLILLLTLLGDSTCLPAAAVL